ncbi:heparin lyase I family protein [Bacteroidota bacterium]
MKVPGLLIICIILLTSTRIVAQKYWIYDGDRQFTTDELYMMEDCGTCSKKKHFNAVKNPPDIPILSDTYARNNKCAEMYFPGCHFSMDRNFCMKVMSQPAGQVQFPYGTDIYHAFSVYVPVDYNHDPETNLIYQFHAYPDDLGNCDNWRSPPFSITFDVDTWRIFGRYSREKCNPDGNRSVKIMILNGQHPIVKGNWTHFVVHLIFDYNAGGRCEVWLKDAENRNPQKIVDYTGPLGYNDKNPPYNYTSFGYYYSAYPGPDIKLYFDRIIFAGSEESMESMMYGE